MAGTELFCKLRPLQVAKNIFWLQARCNQGHASSGVSGSVSAGKSSVNVLKEVPGLSSKCIKPVSGEVGPGASKIGNYKNPEYFSYNSVSYFEAEIEMSKFRIPQPSNKA